MDSGQVVKVFSPGDGSGDGSGYGDGSGDGSGDGDGSGYGSGYGDGSGDGDGSGYGYGSGSGYGDGSGDGDGSGYGYGSGYGDGSGDGDGSGYGYGSGSGYGDGSGSGSGYGYGSGYGSGDGDGSGYGSGYEKAAYWIAAVHYAIRRASKNIISRLVKTGATFAWWRSDKTGNACNGGFGKVHEGLVQKIDGPLRICTSRALHGTSDPLEYKGDGLWIVALTGETQIDGNKIAALEREIVMRVQ